MTYVPPFKPYAHQEEALARLDGIDAYALFMAMRTGKTKVVLDDFGRLELDGKVKQLLVLAPGGVYRTWETAAHEHLSRDLREACKIHVWESGKGAKRERERRAFMTEANQARILIMNVEALSSVKEARMMAASFLSAAPTMLVVDESTVIKNPGSKRTKFINKTLSPLAPVRRILSGLPSPKSPLDLYSQFEFLDWRILGFNSFYTFRARYAKLLPQWFGGRQVQQVIGYQNLEELRRRIAPHSFRKRLEDCYDLPEKVYMLREVSLTEEQTRLYSDMKKFATTQLQESGAHVTATIVITQIIRLHQILCGHVTDEGGQKHQVPTNRVKELLALLEEYDGKAIVWCSYDPDVTMISEALKKEHGEGSVARFWGGNRSTREDEEQQFLNDPDCRFMVATAAAGGRGRTWTVADLVVYYSNTHDLEHRSQSEERPQGIGKIRPVTYVDLVARGTVDEKILHALRNKIDLAATVTGDNFREWLI